MDFTTPRTHYSKEGVPTITTRWQAPTLLTAVAEVVVLKFPSIRAMTCNSFSKF